ncbi:restriction endonuclease [Alicyclobacillus fodiniaquatilis]|uniref:Restriction endonuclease n=1 Tax=Alicyclobacillus fodiniaquatilis TaxID=1661150 RepID=A0ABW4JDV7_9BACL
MIVPLVILLVAMGWFRVKMHIPISPLIFLVIGFLLVLVIVTAILQPSSSRRRFKTQPQMNEIDRMSGEDFEDALEYTLRKKGWRLDTTKKTGDFGADLIGRDPKGRKVVIQAKRWKSNVGVDGVNQVLAAKAYYQADHALVITNHYLTKSAYELSRKTGVEVWSRKRLSAEIRGNMKKNDYKTIKQGR